MAKETIELSPTIIPSILGNKDAHIRMVNNTFNVKTSVFGGQVTIEGEPDAVAQAIKAVQDMANIASDANLTTEKVTDIIRMASDNTPDACEVMADCIQVGGRVKKVYPKSATQKAYVSAIRKQDMVFGIGPAGTGKT
jgi:phosphate starvation-inducible PhoH-like protein